MILASCNSTIYNIFLYPVKNMMTIILIAAPIILIISLLVIFTKGLINPDDKKVVKKVTNAIVATIFVFLVSCIVTVVMKAAGNSTDYSSCWNKATKVNTNPTYEDVYEKEDKKTPEIKIEKTTTSEVNGSSSYVSGTTAGSTAISKMASKVAWPLGSNGKTTYKVKPTDAYKEINDKYIMSKMKKSQKKYAYAKGRSCCVFVCAVVRASYDESYKYCADSAESHMKKSNKWQRISNSQAGAGDIFVKDNYEHILIYGGNVGKKYLWYQANSSGDYGYAFYGKSPAKKSGYHAWHAIQ